jgi:hypothetical protein
MDNVEVKLRLYNLRPMTSSIIGWGCYIRLIIWTLALSLHLFGLFAKSIIDDICSDGA